MKKISAVIACYNDGQAIPLMYKRLIDVFNKIGADYEIIFVNDCSPDDSEETLTSLASKDKKVVVINHSRNFGSQSAFTSGMAVSTGDAVVLLDGDLQDPPELIEDLFRKWQEGYQVVYGIRTKREAKLFMRIAYKLFYRIFNKLSYVHIPLDAGDFSLLDRCVVDVMKILPENNRFIRGLRAWAGFKQIGVPYCRPERQFGKTTNSLLKNIGWARKAIFSFSYLPMEFMVYLAFAVISFSFLGIIFQVALRMTNPSFVPSGFTTLIILILFMGGIQLLCFAIIGSYLEHMYDETKRRPPYIVKNVINKPSPK